VAAGQPVDVPVSGVAADSLGATRLGAIAWTVAGRTGVGSVLVDDATCSRRRERAAARRPDRERWSSSFEALIAPMSR
jgi:hypothetical protein